jgi:hypothetical protein
MTEYPHQLFALEFTEADQSRLVGFSCGSEDWSRHVDEWNCGSDVLDSMKKGTRVWLFETQQGEKRVSFAKMGGSAGKTHGGPAIVAVCGLDKPFGVDVVVRHDILDVEIGGTRSLVNRFWNPSADRLRFFAEGGAVAFRKIRVCPLVETYKPYPGWRRTDKRGPDPR